jgi:hypothetical protein
MNRTILSALVTIAMLASAALAQTLTGTVSDSNGSPLSGANIVIEGTDLGGVSDSNGQYSINVGSGTYSVTASYIGYSSDTKSVIVGGASSSLNFALASDAVELSDIEVLASRVGENAPVAYTNISKVEMEERLGSQDIPMILNTTPSVYATQQGGGAGDSRINIRGFNQRNIAVMINGVPQNDMENGWVYWSNWDGVGDATSSVQVQRGLSAVNLATPSIGGTMNIITDPASFKKGGKFKQESGDGGFMKTTINYNTGLIMDDKLALSGTIVRKTGDGIIDGNWTDAWAYYVGASYAIDDDSRIEMYAIGAPQRHGQNLYRQNIATYSQDLASKINGYSSAAYAPGAQFSYEAGRKFSQNWAPVDPSYTGKQYWYMYGANTTNRYSSNFLNERENYFHKPLVNINYFRTLSDQARLSSVFYWSGGSGGGTGTYGSSSRQPAVEGNAWYASSPWTWDWNARIAANSNNVDSNFSATENRSRGILRNSINRQNTRGIISKVNYDVNEMVEVQVGLDWRSARIEHAREVRDLLGGDYYVDYADDNVSGGKVVRLGDIIAYHNDTTVDWLGGFVQGTYTTDKINAYGMYGLSSIEYSYQDHFTVANEVITADPISAYQVKGGVNYAASETMSAFFNTGYVQKAPILDNVIYTDGTVASDPANEKFLHNEYGLSLSGLGWDLKVSMYNTEWQDRNLTKSVTSGQGDSGDTDVIFLRGVDQVHTGTEIEYAYKLSDMVDLNFVASLGNWKFDGDAEGTYQENEYNAEGQVIGIQNTEYQYALDGLYVGDMPQTSYVVGLTVRPMSGLRIQALHHMYDKNYSDWSPDSREFDGSDADADRAQVWEAPGYSKMDLHVSYDLPTWNGLDMTLQGHIFNVFDDVFIQDATDNSQYNGFGPKAHQAHNAEVFLGTPRYTNISLSINF